MRVYTVSLVTAAVTTARTLAILENPADTALLIIGASVGAPTDDTNEQLDLTFQTINVLGAPTGTAVTPSRHSPGDALSGVTATVNITASEPSYVANTEVGHESAASVGAGWRYDPLELKRYMQISPSTNVGLRLISTISSKTLVVRVTFIEIGG